MKLIHVPDCQRLIAEIRLDKTMGLFIYYNNMFMNVIGGNNVIDSTINKIIDHSLTFQL